jgi:thioredoxin reductase (NADPH)
VFLASEVARVHLLVRGDSLSESMSQYLVDRIMALPNVEVHTETELTGLTGDPEQGLQAVWWRTPSSAEAEQHAIRYVFLFIGAVPSTDWLQRCDVTVDPKGFVRTGAPTARHVPLHDGASPEALSLETSLHGVFAAGDVRAGSVKRVSAAVGDGAAVAAQLHLYLQAVRSARPGNWR